MGTLANQVIMLQHEMTQMRVLLSQVVKGEDMTAVQEAMTIPESTETALNCRGPNWENAICIPKTIGIQTTHVSDFQACRRQCTRWSKRSDGIGCCSLLAIGNMCSYYPAYSVTSNPLGWFIPKKLTDVVKCY